MSQISKVTINQEPDHYTVTIRKTIDFTKNFPETAGKAFSDTAQYISEMGLSPLRGPIVCFHNKKLKACDVEMGWQITQKVQNKGDMVCHFVPSRKIATAIDLGPYRDSDPTMLAVFEFTKENGYEIQDTVYNCYLNDPERLENQYLTEIYLPIK